MNTAMQVRQAGAVASISIPGSPSSSECVRSCCVAAQVLVFVVFAATDARRASLEAHIPVSMQIAAHLRLHNAC